MHFAARQGSGVSGTDLKEPLPVISKYSKLVGWWSTEVGPLNEVVHIWAYEDPNHREHARKAQGEDPQLQAFRPKAQAMIVSQYNKIRSRQLLSPEIGVCCMRDRGLVFLARPGRHDCRGSQASSAPNRP